jgi:hypothetical protein
MRMFRGKNRVIHVLFLMVGVFFAIFFTACSTSGQPDGSAIVAPALSVPNVLSEELTHSPVGTLDMTWDAHSHELTVKVSATGLAPDSTHPEHIHAGTCASTPMGVIVYILNPLVADAHGVGTAETTIANVSHGIPVQGWYLNIHNGPTLNTPEEANPIACANITEKDASSSPVHALLTGTMAPDESAHGNAQLNITGNKLIVTLNMSGLVPHSAHIAHIHTGSCASQGAVVYPLQVITADAQGNATNSTTLTISNVQQFTSSQFYINVHEAGTMDGMSKQQGFDPIACGDIIFHV